MPRASEITATIRSRIKDIDMQVLELRCQQRGLEVALGIALGEAPIVEVKRRVRKVKMAA